MKQIRLKIFFLIVFVFSFSSYLHTQIKGSESVLSVEDFYTFPDADSDNKMLGFGWFKNGFGLEAATTTCTFDSVFPVSGNVYLNGGDLHLASDLFFRNMTTWYTSGGIYGNDFLVDLSSSVTGIASTVNEQLFDNASVNINSDLIISGTVRFSGDCSLNGNGKRILLNTDGFIVLDQNTTVTFKDVYIDGITSDKIICLDNSGSIVLDDVRWIQDDDYTFNNGSIKFFNTVDLVGSHTFFYNSSQTSTIDTHSFLNLSQGMKLSIGRYSGIDDDEPLNFVDNTSVLGLENCCLSITSSGMSLLRGLMIIDRGVTIEMNSTCSDDGLIIGNGVEADDMEFRFHPGARVLFPKGHLVYENTDPRSLRSRSGEALFVREADSVFYLNRDVQLEGIALDTNPNSSMFVADGKYLKYVGCRIIYPGIEFELGGSRYNDYTNYMSGDEEMFLLRGTLSPYTYVIGSNNTLHGNGDISGKIILQDSDAELSVNLNGAMSNNVDLNGGKISLDHDFIFTQGAFFENSGYVDLNEFTLDSGVNELSLSSTVTWNSDGGSIRLGAKVKIDGRWLFDGSTSIDGDGHTIELGSGGEILVGEGSSLSMKNIRIEGINSNNIRCLGGDSSISFNDVKLIQDGNFSFTKGSLSFYNMVHLRGPYDFSYESNNTSTIRIDSELVPCEGINFIISRNNGVEPLYFEDTSSVLHLDNCTFSTVGEGASINRGTLLCHHEVILDIDSTDSTNGLVLGSGSPEDDSELVFEVGASVHFLRGHLVYNITEPDCLKARSTNSQLIRYADTTFYLNQDIVMSDFTIVDRNIGAAMVVADGKTVEYDNIILEWTGVGVNVSGYRYNWYTILLAGGKEIFLLKGSFPVVILAQGPGNLLHGGGSVAQQIALADSTSELQVKLNGPLINSVSLAGGKLTLLKDLEFSKGYKVSDSGVIYVGDNKFSMGPLEQDWEGDILWQATHGHIDLNSKVELSGTWTFSGDNTLHGLGNTLVLGDDANIVVDEDSSLTLKDLKIEGLSGNKIRCLNDSGSLCIDNTSLVQDADFSFTVGSMSFYSKSLFSGNYTFSYESTQTSTINKNSTWSFGKGTRFYIGRSEYCGDIEPLYMEDETSVLKLNGCDFAISSSGMRVTRGTIGISKDVGLDILSTCSDDGFFIGDGTSAGDVVINFYPGSCLSFNGGDLILDQDRDDFVDVKNGTACLARNGFNKLHVKGDTSLKNLTVRSGLYSQTFVDDGKVLSYENTTMETSAMDFVLTGNQGMAFCDRLVGDSDFFLKKGNMPYGLYIWNSGNTIRGNGTISGAIELQDSDAELALCLNGLISNNISMGGGKVSLDGNLNFASDKMFTGDGTVNLGTNILNLGTVDKGSTGSIYWDGEEGLININSNISLSGTWTFSGTCIIKGNWNVLELGEDAEIVVERGSKLLFKDTKIKDLSGNKIRCLDEHSVVEFYEAKAKLDSDFTFTQGSINIVDTFEVHGMAKFIYSSPVRLCICRCGYLKMMEGTTLSYAPPSVERNLISMENCYSFLELNGATLHSTSTGLQLTKGVVLISQDSYLSSDASVKSEGITFGDGISSDNDVTVKVMGNCDLTLLSGHVVDKNVS